MTAKRKSAESTITATTFYQYSKCPAWPWHEAFSDPKKRAPVSALAEKLWRDGLLHESEMIALKKKNFEVTEIPHEGDLDERAIQTLALMKKGVPVIYHGVLTHGRWVGIPDILEKVDGKSELGEWFYVPCDIKRSSHVDEVHRLQLCFYSELLKRLQGRRPERGYIIDASGVTNEVVIADIEEKFKLNLKEIEALLSGTKPNPHLYGSCKQSPWFHQCILDAEDCEDVSLIYKIRSEERDELHRLGVGTLPKLAEANAHKLKRRAKGMTEPRLEKLILQAQALKDSKAIVTEKWEAPKVKTEIYFDMESDPLRDVHYLFGCLIVKGDKSEYKKFLAKKPEDEGKAWAAFQRFVGRYKDVAIYHYGWYEIIVIKELTAKYGISKSAANVLQSGTMIDLLPILSRCVIFPVYFYSLKDIAKFLGFKWRAKDASGANSISWYHEYLEKKDLKILKRIVDYNEDDVIATKLVVDWLKKQS